MGTMTLYYEMGECQQSTKRVIPAIITVLSSEHTTNTGKEGWKLTQYSLQSPTNHGAGRSLALASFKHWHSTANEHGSAAVSSILLGFVFHN